MTKRQAIKALKSQLEKLEKSSIQPDEYWIDQTRILFLRVFGKDSIQYQKISRIDHNVFHFDSGVTIKVGTEGPPDEELKKLMQNAIETVKSDFFQPLKTDAREVSTTITPKNKINWKLIGSIATAVSIIGAILLRLLG